MSSTTVSSNVSFTHYLSPSWDTLCQRTISRWILRRALLLPSGPFPTPASSSNVSLGLPISIGDSSANTELWLPRSLPSQAPGLPSTGHQLLRVPSNMLGLKSRFTSAPILQMPDPGLQFVVEVDALDVGVEAFYPKDSPPTRNSTPAPFERVGGPHP